MQPILRLFVCLTLLGVLPGCATIALNIAQQAAFGTVPWTGEVAISSEPEGARCAVHRDGRVLAELPATPGSVRLERSLHSAEIRCTAPGRLETAVLLRSEQDFGTVRVMPTGIIGLTTSVIALANATNARYPGNIGLRLPPEQFESEAARDAWFDARRAEIIAQRAPLIVAERGRCMPQDTSVCELGLMTLQNQEAEDLALIDAQRRTARIGQD